MEFYLMTAVACLAGLFFIIRNLLMLKYEDRLVTYLQTNPKGRLLVNKYGMDEAVNKAKKIFIPLGCVLGGLLFMAGARNLLIIINQI